MVLLATDSPWWFFCRFHEDSWSVFPPSDSIKVLLFRNSKAVGIPLHISFCVFGSVSYLSRTHFIQEKILRRNIVQEATPTWRQASLTANLTLLPPPTPRQSPIIYCTNHCGCRILVPFLRFVEEFHWRHRNWTFFTCLIDCMSKLWKMLDWSSSLSYYTSLTSVSNSTSDGLSI